MKAFDHVNTTGLEGGSTILDRIVDMIQASFDSLVNAVTNDRLVQFKLDNTQDWPVTHGCGAAVRTWDVVNIDASATVWQSQAANNRATSVILLRASAPCNVLLRFT